jgi:hypothetical protein
MTLAVPLLPPIDQWGYEPFPVQPLTAGLIVPPGQGPLAGDSVGTWTYSWTPVQDTEPEQPLQGHSSRLTPPRDWQQAWTRKRLDMEHLVGVDDELAAVDKRTGETEPPGIGPTRGRNRSLNQQFSWAGRIP